MPLAPLAPLVKMSDGNAIPQIGLGTWPMKDVEVADVIVDAIELGYRHLDTAVNYGNEVGVGDGVRRSGISREEMFITTKVPGRDHGYDETRRSLEESLERMQLDYIDLYLIHWPNPNVDKYVETWRAFIDAQKDGKVRSIGVSNFTPAHLSRLVSETGVMPAVNQIQLYPAIPQHESRSFHEQHDIVTESWSPLGLGANVAFHGGDRRFLEHPVLVDLATKYERSTAQILLRWHVQQGLVPLPKSSNRQRLADNIDVFSFSIASEDMDLMSTIDNDDVNIANSDVHEEL
jgi:2,5-diketo-D-gluconate reductase A